MIPGTKLRNRRPRIAVRKLFSSFFMALSLVVLLGGQQAMAITKNDLDCQADQTCFYDPTATQCSNIGNIGTAVLSPSQNAKTAYDYLIGKGLKDFQAAGLMGNLKAESGINPRRVQGTLTPQGDSDTMTIDGKTGYGIAQWTSIGRQQNLHAAAVKAGTKDGDLGVQLDYLWSELNSGYKTSTLEPLLQSSTIEEATHVVLYNFENPQEKIQNLINRTRYAKGYLKLYGSDAPTVNNPNNPTPTGGSSSGPKPTIVLDPGHSGKDVTKVDAATGLDMHDYPNPFEIDEVFEIASAVKDKLTTDGYNVIMTKQSANQTILFRERANIANDANADLAVSIHDDHTQPWDSFAQVYTQKVGLYRVGEKGKVTFANKDVAQKSQQYGDIFVKQRSADEGHKVVSTNVNFAGRSGIDPGNISQVQLMANVPWVYNEVGAPDGKALSSSDEHKYEQGLIDSIEKSVPVDSTQTTDDSSGCSTTDQSGDGVVQGDIVKTALDLAWSTGGHGKDQADAKPTYQVAMPKYNGSTGDDEYSDCGVFVATTMIASGVDPNYPKRGTSIQMPYLENSKKYTQIKTTSTSDLKPGDIFINSQHTYLYIGPQSGGYNAVSASLHGHVPENAGDVHFYQDGTTGEQFKIFRYIGGSS